MYIFKINIRIKQNFNTIVVYLGPNTDLKVLLVLTADIIEDEYVLKLMMV